MPSVVYQVIYSIVAVAAAWLMKNFVSDRLIDNFTKS